MRSLTDSLPTAPTLREAIPPNAEAALWHACRAEAESMWTELHLRLRADESRKAAFIDHMARDLMNKTTRKRRGQLLQRLAGNPAPTDQQAA